MVQKFSENYPGKGFSTFDSLKTGGLLQKTDFSALNTLLGVFISSSPFFPSSVEGTVHLGIFFKPDSQDSDPISSLFLLSTAGLL
jgi:hypothetical protein